MKRSKTDEMSARRVHAVLAAAMDDPRLIAQWRSQGGQAGFDLERMRLFAGLATKVRHNDVRLALPLTFRLLDLLGISIDAFAGYAARAAALRKANQKSKAAKIVALSAFLDDWLDPTDAEHALVRDMIRHERSLHELGAAPAADGAANPAKVSAASVPRRCEPMMHYETSCHPLELARALGAARPDLTGLERGRFPYVYRRRAGDARLSIEMIDELGFVLIELADGTRSVGQMRTVLRQAGVAVAAADLRQVVQDLIDSGILTLTNRMGSSNAPGARRQLRDAGPA
jgi:hypothetical protein